MALTSNSCVSLEWLKAMSAREVPLILASWSPSEDIRAIASMVAEYPSEARSADKRAGLFNPASAKHWLWSIWILGRGDSISSFPGVVFICTWAGLELNCRLAGVVLTPICANCWSILSCTTITSKIIQRGFTRFTRIFLFYFNFTLIHLNQICLLKLLNFIFLISSALIHSKSASFRVYVICLRQEVDQGGLDYTGAGCQRSLVDVFFHLHVHDYLGFVDIFGRGQKSGKLRLST